MLKEPHAAMFKAEVREQALRLRRVTDEPSEPIENTALAFLGAGRVMCYVSMNSEVETDLILSSLIESGRAYVPYTVDGIITPRRLLSMPNRVDGLGNVEAELMGEESDIDISVTPIVAFDKMYRVGYGKGCYDRFFAKNPSVVKIGLAFDEQEFAFTPESNDIPLDIIVTQSRVLKRGF